MGERVVLDIAGEIAQRIEFGQAPRALRRLSTKPARAHAERALQRGSASAALAFSLKAGAVDSIMLVLSGDRRLGDFAGQHFGDVADLDLLPNG